MIKNKLGLILSIIIISAIILALILFCKDYSRNKIAKYQPSTENEEEASSESTETLGLDEEVAKEDEAEDVDEKLKSQLEKQYSHLLVEYDENGNYYDEAGFDKTLTIYKWGADATSLYAYLENGDADILAAHEADDVYDETIDFLSKAWDIYDRASAKAIINKTLLYGHQLSFKEYLDDEDVRKTVKAIKKDYGKDFSFDDARKINETYFKEHGISTRYFYKVKATACAYVRFGEEGLKGYDYLRLMRVIALSYECGYLTSEETYQLLYNIENELQQNYESFQEIHECYYYGEMFRMKTKTDQATITLNDIEDAIDEMVTKRYYQKIEKRYGREINLEVEDK